jgi:hypothetical protein
MKHALIVCGALGLLCSCSAADAGLSLDSRSAALSAEQCSFFDTNGKVLICHATSSKKNPYVAIRVSEQGCINGHAGHEGDYVALTDTMCLGGSCLADGAPCDGTLDCCDGSECSAGGTCTPVPPVAPSCRAMAESCDTNADCCAGLYCLLGAGAVCGMAG